MKYATIEEIAYRIKNAKKYNKPRAIFFLGAGASKSGGIPLASEIAKDILKRFQDHPEIQNLGEKEKTYTKLMEKLSPLERNYLLKSYIDKAKINVTHIYLAHLMVNDFVDYVVTVNFDNLMIRALALFNIFPPIYDMAILKELTTQTFYEKSIIYLHGQHYGLWLLNTDEEMQKVKKTIPAIFNRIANQRTWIVIGYSGEDLIFDYIQDLGRFSNRLYWVCYNEKNLNKKVRDFLSKPNTEAFIVKDYDADSFMLKLNNELGLPEPDIINKPFTSLEKMLSNIIDIDSEKFKGVNERLKIAKNNVQEAKSLFENMNQQVFNINKIKKTSEIDELKKKIINLIIKGNYDTEMIKEIENKAKKIRDVSNLLADFYFNWGVILGKLADSKQEREAENLYFDAIEKFKKVIEIKPDDQGAYYNWGTYLIKLATIKKGNEAENLYLDAIEKFKKATEIKPDFYEAYNNWGTALWKLADTKQDQEAENLYNEAIEKFKKAIEVRPDDPEAYYNWGITLWKLAEKKQINEAENLYLDAIEKFKKATEIKPDFYEAYNGWGNCLGNIANTKESKEAEYLYYQAFEKFKKAIEIKSDYYIAYKNWGIYLDNFAKTKQGKEAEEIRKQAIEKYQKAVELGGSSYNLACLYAAKGEITKALQLLETSLKNNEVTPEFVVNDSNWEGYLNNPDFVNLIKKYEKS